MNLKGSKGGTMGNVQSRGHEELEGGIWGLNCFSLAMIRDHVQGKLQGGKKKSLSGPYGFRGWVQDGRTEVASGRLLEQQLWAHIVKSKKTAEYMQTTEPIYLSPCAHMHTLMNTHTHKHACIHQKKKKQEKVFSLPFTILYNIFPSTKSGSRQIWFPSPVRSQHLPRTRNSVNAGRTQWHRAGACWQWQCLSLRDC